MILDAISDFYTTQSQRFGPSGALPHHRDRANRLNNALGGRIGRVLELGAGAGGSAAAAAELGHRVTAVELSPLRAEYAKTLAAQVSPSPEIIEGDFYTAEVGNGYDAVVYWNGFGMNEDADQRRLLNRVVSEWLTPAGFMLVDVFNPFWWARLPGEIKLHEEFGVYQQTTFDPIRQRFIDRWWPQNESKEAIEQSIRCYSPADLTLLLEPTELRIASIQPADGKALADSHSYLATLVRR